MLGPISMGWPRLVGSLNRQVSFTKSGILVELFRTRELLFEEDYSSEPPYIFVGLITE